MITTDADALATLQPPQDLDTPTAKLAETGTRRVSHTVAGRKGAYVAVVLR